MVKAAGSRTSGQNSLFPLLLVAPYSAYINSPLTFILLGHSRAIYNLSPCLSSERSSPPPLPSLWAPSSLPALSSSTASTPSATPSPTPESSRTTPATPTSRTASTKLISVNLRMSI